MDLHLREGELRFFDPKTGAYVRTLDEEAEAAAKAQSEAAQARQDAAEAERRAAEAERELAALRAKLAAPEPPP